MSQADELRLEAGVGGQHPSGRPFHYSTPNQEDRIRRVFGLSDDAPLPAVDDRALATYYDHLVATLAFPIEVLYCPAGGESRQLIHYLSVTELIDPGQSRKANMHGLYCRARNAQHTLELPLAELGVRDDNPNCQTIDDYAYWFVNFR